MQNSDWQGIATVIGALAALFTALAAIMARKPVQETHAAVTATNGDTRALGIIAADIAKSVAPDPNHDPEPDAPPAPPAV